MGTICDIEFRPVELSPAERAEARDSYVRNFDRQFRDWADIAQCCLSVKRDRDWHTLGFHSFEAWLMDAAPASRRYIFLVMARYEKLEDDMTPEELSEIPLGSAAVLVQVSPAARKDPKVRKAAKQKPAELIKVVQELHPEQHVEQRIKKTVEFTETQWSVVEATFEKYKVLQGECSFADFIEWCCSEVSEWTLHAEKDDKGRQDDIDRVRLQ